MFTFKDRCYCEIQNAITAAHAAINKTIFIFVQDTLTHLFLG